MKSYIKILQFSFILFFFIAACEDDSATGIDEDDLDKLIGTWNVSEYSETFKDQNYTVNIQKGTDNDKKSIVIYNFFNLGNSHTINATISGQKITIKKQEIDKNIVEGEGNIASSYKNIDFEYTVDFGYGAENVTAHYTNRPIAKTKEEEVALK